MMEMVQIITATITLSLSMNIISDLSLLFECPLHFFPTSVIPGHIVKYRRKRSSCNKVILKDFLTARQWEKITLV